MCIMRKKGIKLLINFYWGKYFLIIVAHTIRFLILFTVYDMQWGSTNITVHNIGYYMFIILFTVHNIGYYMFYFSLEILAKNLYWVGAANATNG